MSDYIVIHGIKVHKDYQNFVPETFGRLTTLGPRFIIKDHSYQVCQCNCPNKNVTVVLRRSLVTGNTKSCGCLSPQLTIERNTIHGQSKTTEHRLWRGILDRCYNKNNKKYHNYGGRGIRVCDRWLEANGQGFMNFLADMGRRPPECDSINRKNNNGNYAPTNCEWTTTKKQNRNTRRNKMLTALGKTQCLIQWVEETGLSLATIRGRLRRNWDVEKALTTPMKRKDNA